MNTLVMRILFSVAVSILVAVPAYSHHSGVMYDAEKQITLEGVVKEFQYTNPHSWLLVNVKSEDGKVTTWGFEAEGPSTMRRGGIKKSDFSPGTEIIITGRPLKDGRPAAAWVRAIRKEDGKEFNPRAGFKIR